MTRPRRGRRLLVHEPSSAAPPRRCARRCSSCMARAAAPASGAVLMSSRPQASSASSSNPAVPSRGSRFPVLRYMRTYGLTHEQLATVSDVQRGWTATNPRATFKTPITIEDVLSSRIIAYPFVTRTQYPGIRFPPTEPFERRSSNGRFGATLPFDQPARTANMRQTAGERLMFYLRRPGRRRPAGAVAIGAAAPQTERTQQEDFRPWT